MGLSFLAIALQKARLRAWLSREVSLLNVSFEKRNAVVQDIQNADLPQEVKEAESAPWKNILGSGYDAEIRSGNMVNVRAKVLGLMQELLAAHGLQGAFGNKLGSQAEEAEQEKQRWLQKASCHRSKHVKFVVLNKAAPTKADYDACMEDLLPECAAPGELNKQHRLFVLQVEHLQEAARTQASLHAELKELVRFGMACCAGSGDLLLVSDSGDEASRQKILQEMEVCKRFGNVGGITVVWTRPPRAVRQVFGCTQQVSNMILYCRSPRVKVSAVPRQD